MIMFTPAKLWLRLEKRSVSSKLTSLLKYSNTEEPVRKLISKVRNVLEAQAPRPRSRVTSIAAPTTEAINVRTDPRHFESFLRSINRCSSLLDARRLKNDIMGEIRRTRKLLGESKLDTSRLLY